MSEELIKVADEADMIVNGYAFKLKDGHVSILNLNRPDRAAVLTMDGEMLETSMDDIELSIVQNYLQKSEHDMRCIQAFIKDNYQEMYLKWSLLSNQGYFGEK